MKLTKYKIYSKVFDFVFLFNQSIKFAKCTQMIIEEMIAVHKFFVLLLRSSVSLTLKHLIKLISFSPSHPSH